MAGENAAREELKAEVARQRAEGVALREQLLWRMEALTAGQSIDLSKHIDHFPEVTEALSVPGLEPGLAGGEEGSVASLEDGGSLVLTGFLSTPPPHQFVAVFKRRLQFEQNLAIHEKLEVEPPFRGRGISLRFLHSSFKFYDALGLEEVHLKTGLATGRWHWARMGFEFLPSHDGCAQMGAWAAEVCKALGIRELNVETYSSAAQFARMGGNRKVSFEQLVSAMPSKRARLEELAKGNGLEMEERIGLGRAVMLSGPDWHGYLQLDGPSRVAFELALQGKEERLARAGQD